MRRVVPSVLVFGVAFGVACGAPHQIGGQPRWRKTVTQGAKVAGSKQISTFTPTTTAAAGYNDPPMTPAPSSAVGDAIAAAVDDAARQAGIDPPIADGRLYAAADDIAEVMPDEGVVAYPLVEFALQHHGIIEPSPHLLVVWGPLDDPSALVEQLRPRLAELLAGDARLRLGVGVAAGDDGAGKVVVALQPFAVATDPIPRELPDGGTVRIKGSVAAPFSGPEVFVTRSDGTVSRAHADVDGSPRGFDAKVDCEDQPGTMQVEIAASDKAGSTVLANFPVFCHQAAPTSLTLGVAADDTKPPASESDAEQRMFTMLNDDRAQNGLPALAWDERAAAVARGHSEEMRKTGEVAHISPTTGTAADRVKAGNIKTAVVLENIARAYGVGEAEQGLMNSPGHRANLLSKDVTHVGIGIVFGDEVAGQREMFVTQVFIRIGPPIDVDAVTRTVREKVLAVRTLESDDALDKIAAEYAQRLAKGDDRKTAAAAANRELEGFGARYRRVGSVVTTVADLSALDPKAMLGDELATNVGIGVAQGTSDDMGEGAVFVVLLLAVAR